MKFTFKELRSSLLVPSISDHSVVQNLTAVSKGFTSQRSKIKEYVMDREMVSAYTLFYLPSNIPKLEFVFDMLSDDVKESIKSSTIVDLGTGPGTFAFALDEYFDGDVEVVGVDTSELMVEQAQKINECLYKNQKISFRSTMPKSFKGETLLLGHSLNEMGIEKLMDLVKLHAPENLIIIEPGTSAMFTEVLKLREQMRELGFQCAFPCANIESKCPVQKKIEEGQEDWCHQVLRMTHEVDFERLSQIAKLDRKTMPLIAHVYTKTNLKGPKRARMVRFLRESKFSFDWEVCFESEGELKMATFEVLKKTLSKKEVKSLQKISVGIDFDYEIMKEINSGHFKVKLL
ncbi:conserved hypothetical protein [Halobacteriovorax marinus SJ]|uniref:Methyltransferase domain-containing protein n=1 Tax=Halobacteriovorax marinus (strain ATCC BAA-682 / DSM 15412 / SJ) TaxID=862908 RepID=E1WXU6_HALMS|nr:small ribosomal subunit Rsm22 family protein [Halobacteriovorax marinus]CBW25903.1 conserved hypothetical protein [Halobacteriovorax marinus SJ]